MSDDQINLNECLDALAKRTQEAFQAKLRLYGGQERWFEACHARNATDSDYAYARAIVRLMRRGDDPVAETMRRHWHTLSQDPDLHAYWQSVAGAGQDGWREERKRIRAVQTEAYRSDEPIKRYLSLDLPATKSLLATYRQWGRVLLSSGWQKQF